MQMTGPKLSESGMSLVSAMMGVAIASLVMAAMGNMIKTSNVATKRMQLLSERQEIKELLLRQVDCGQTLGAQPVSCSGSIDLKDASGTTLFYPIGEVYPLNSSSKWFVRAECDSSDPDIHLRVKVAAVKKPNPPTTTDPDHFYKDEFNKVMDWNNERAVLWTNKPVLCESYFAGGAANWNTVPAGTLVGFCQKSGSTCSSYVAPAKVDQTCEPGFAIQALSSSSFSCIKL